MIFKLSKTGKFLSCSKFPECDGVKSIEEEIDEAVFFTKYEKAPRAEDGSEMILKSGRYGKYWAHPDYPKVKEAKPLVLIEKCPQCGKGLVERKGKWGKTFIGCSGYPECKYIKKGGKKRE
jgi:DNA topoisomerase-1